MQGPQKVPQIFTIVILLFEKRSSLVTGCPSRSTVLKDKVVFPASEAAVGPLPEEVLSCESVLPPAASAMTCAAASASTAPEVLPEPASSCDSAVPVSDEFPEFPHAAEDIAMMTAPSKANSCFFFIFDLLVDEWLQCIDPPGTGVVFRKMFRILFRI